MWNYSYQIWKWKLVQKVKIKVQVNPSQKNSKKCQIFAIKCQFFVSRSYANFSNPCSKYWINCTNIGRRIIIFNVYKFNFMLSNISIWEQKIELFF